MLWSSEVAPTIYKKTTLLKGVIADPSASSSLYLTCMKLFWIPRWLIIFAWYSTFFHATPWKRGGGKSMFTVVINLLLTIFVTGEAIRQWFSRMTKWKLLPNRMKSNNKSFMMTSSNGNVFRVTGHLCGEFTGPGEFPTQRPVTRSFFFLLFDLRPNKRLSKHWWGWWFETPSCPLWRHCYVCAVTQTFFYVSPSGLQKITQLSNFIH